MYPAGQTFLVLGCISAEAFSASGPFTAVLIRSVPLSEADLRSNLARTSILLNEVMETGGKL